MPWRLDILEEGGGRRSVSLDADGWVVVGRSRQCDIQLNARFISRRHCRLRFGEGYWSIEDLESSNGTYVNGEKVGRAELQAGDRIRVGDLELRLVSLSAADWQEPERRGEPGLPDAVAPRHEGVKLLGGRYELGEMFHRGATGGLYRGRDVQLGRTVCVKVVAKHVTEHKAELKRFVRGLRSAGKLPHPNIVQVYHAGKTSDGAWWLASEYVDGPSARRLASEAGIGKMLSPSQVLAIAVDVTAALQAAYRRQIVHRSIKPDHVLLTKDGVAKLNNFTLARGVVLSTLQQITVSGELVGDLTYMAPELTVPGEQGDCRADLYGLGACLYVLLTGRPPFTGRGKADLIRKIRDDDPVPPSRHNLSVGAPLEGAVLKCLAKSPADRFNSPDELAKELERISRFGVR